MSSFALYCVSLRFIIISTVKRKLRLDVTAPRLHAHTCVVRDTMCVGVFYIFIIIIKSLFYEGYTWRTNNISFLYKIWPSITIRNNKLHDIGRIVGSDHREKSRFKCNYPIMYYARSCQTFDNCSNKKGIQKVLGKCLSNIYFMPREAKICQQYGLIQFRLIDQFPEM